MQRKLACMANHKERFFTPFKDVTVMKDDPVYKASVSAASGSHASGRERTGSADLSAVCVFLSLRDGQIGLQMTWIWRSAF